ncbi:MAG: ABC transporter substrate-binding protein, partial [Candidatus Paceibacterota bacterium]
MGIFNSILLSLTRKERLIVVLTLVIFIMSLFTRVVIAVKENSQFVPVQGGSYVEGIIGQPSLINPIVSNDPIDHDLSSLVYSKLGGIASGITVSENGRSYTVNIPENLMWSDGERLTTDDIIFTVNIIQSSEINSPLSKSWQGVIVERISELQVKFTLPSSYVFFENNINRLPILPSHIFSSIPSSNFKLSSYNLEPIGSGPYKFEDFKRRRDGFITEYHFTVNSNYHKEAPFIKDFYFKFYESEEDLMDAFKKREIDGFGTSSFLSESSSFANSVVKELEMPRYYAVFFNPQSTSALSNDDLRLALKSSINRDDLIREVLGNKGNTVNGPLYFEESNLLSLDEARAIIEEVKEDRTELVIEIVVPDVEFIKNTAEFIKREWENVGVDEVSILSLSSEDFVSSVIRERNYEAVVFGNILENPLDLFPFWHSSQRFYPGLNLSVYSEEEADGLIEDIRQTEDESERLVKFEELIDIINSDSPAAFLFSLPYTYIHHNKLGGLNPDDFNIFNEGLITPSDRFKKVDKWHVKRA